MFQKICLKCVKELKDHAVVDVLLFLSWISYTGWVRSPTTRTAQSPAWSSACITGTRRAPGTTCTVNPTTTGCVKSAPVHSFVLDWHFRFAVNTLNLWLVHKMKRPFLVLVKPPIVKKVWEFWLFDWNSNIHVPFVELILFLNRPILYLNQQV